MSLKTAINPIYSIKISIIYKLRCFGHNHFKNMFTWSLDLLFLALVSIIAAVMLRKCTL